MTPTYLPSLEPDTQRREKIRRRVRPTSIAQYADGRERFIGRKADVLKWVAHDFNRTQRCPTSAEIAGYHKGYDTDSLLYVRRGLSDLQGDGVVESAGKRRCMVSGRIVETWRVITVGRK